MPNTIIKRPHRLSRHALLAAIVAVAMLSGGCSLMPHKPQSTSATNSVDDSAHPLTDDQAMAQVVEPAKQIVVAADLQSVSGGFSFSSCNDQGDPPYMGAVTISFLIHGDSDAYFQQVRSAMKAHGWSDGAPPGQRYFGTTLNKDGVAANMGLLPSDHSYGQINLYGQCRNTTDHHHDGKTNATDITNQLNAR
jgi:hypothetical protein